jgi:hypothetical protein
MLASELGLATCKADFVADMPKKQGLATYGAIFVADWLFL